MKKTLYLHIGMHKTGSTALQVFLTKNRIELENMGISYPKVGCPDESPYGQHNIAWCFFSNKNFLPIFNGVSFSQSNYVKESYIKELKELLSRDEINSIILSSEEFSILSENEINNFLSNFENINIEIIIYLRRQDYYLESAYGTSILYSQYKKNFYDFTMNQRMNLNYYEVVKNWENYSDTVHVKSYETSDIKKDIVSDFLDTININGYFKSKKIEKVNKSIGVDGVEVIRGLRLRSYSEEELIYLRSKLEVFYSNYSKKDLGRFFTKELYMYIVKKYAYSNSILHKNYSCNLEFEDSFDSDLSLKSFEQSLEKLLLQCLKEKL